MNDIAKKQNTKEILDALYTQRVLYTRAEAMDIIIILIFIVEMFFTNFINVLDIYKFIILLIITGIMFIIKNMFENNIERAANVQEYIDKELYEMNDKKMLKVQLNETNETIVKTVAQGGKYYISQVENDGFKEGVKDWYNIDSNLSLKEAIFNCQKENAWWSKKISKIHLCMRAIIYFLLIISFGLIFKNNIYAFYIIIFQLIIYLLNKEITYSNKNKILNGINIRQKDIEKLNNISKKNLEIIQDEIYKYRCVKYKSPDYIYKLCSKKLHKMYNKIVSFGKEE
jgi:hypothetical protein